MKERKNKKPQMNKQRKHYSTSFFSFFQISVEETGRNFLPGGKKCGKKKTCFFPPALEETGKPYFCAPFSNKLVRYSKHKNNED